MTGATLRPIHMLFAVIVMAIWGSNFVLVKYVFEQFRPMTLATLRFIAVVVPLIFFVKRPAISWGNLAAYGVLIGGGQFGFMFTALRADITPGLASLLMQSQVFFTIGLAALIDGERIKGFQFGALLLALAGIVMIALHTDGTVTPKGLILILLAALSWACGNMVSRAAGKVDMLAYVVWSSVFAIPPLLVMALYFDGADRMMTDIAAAKMSGWATILWQAVANAMFGYGVWGWLLSRYPAATVAPLALLIPVFGIGSSVMFLGEPLQDWKLLAAGLVMAGLAIGILGSRLNRRGA